MAVPCSQQVTTAAGNKRADALAALVPAPAWQTLSCGDGAKGPRRYDWALIATASADHQLLVRRSLAPGEKGELELAYFLCYAPRGATLAELVAVAGARWAIDRRKNPPAVQPAHPRHPSGEPPRALVTLAPPPPGPHPAVPLRTQNQRSPWWGVGDWRGFRCRGPVSSPRPVKPCMRFSRTRLTDVLHRRCSAFPRQSR